MSQRADARPLVILKFNPPFYRRNAGGRRDSGYGQRRCLLFRDELSPNFTERVVRCMNVDVNLAVHQCPQQIGGQGFVVRTPPHAGGRVAIKCARDGVNHGSRRTRHATMKMSRLDRTAQIVNRDVEHYLHPSSPGALQCE